MTAERATKLEKYIKAGDLNSVKNLLSTVTDFQVVKELENTFIETDPVNLAINCHEEVIAIYLVEKGFSVDRVYQLASKRCDHWSYSKLEENKCPAEYDACDNAASKKFHKLKELIDGIRMGRRRPGDGLTDADDLAPAYERLSFQPVPPANAKPQFQRLNVSKTHKEKPKSAAFEAISLLQRYGNKVVSKDGWTLMHRYATTTPAHIYVMANNQVPINVQNADGDTALHIAVKNNNFETTEALLQCCSDVTIRNKMGQTVLDLATGEMKQILQKYEPDPIKCVMIGEVAGLLRHFRDWLNISCNVKDGMSLLQLAMVKVNEDPSLVDTCRVLHDYRPTSELIHCVLSEDTHRLHEILSTNKGYSVNLRFRDRKGKTLLSHAIESNNLEVVKMLVHAGAKVNSIRVRESGRGEVTVPLFHKALNKDLQPDIAHFIHSVQDATEMMEKDYNGNTALLRAVAEGAGERIIDWLLVADNGQNLIHRNQQGMNARELAVSKGRSDLVQAIDRFVLQQRGKFFLVKLPVHFYGFDNLQFTDEQLGKTLLKVVEEGKDKDDKKVMMHYNEIEDRGVQLFEAAANGDMEKVKKLNAANFQDKNGYTALIRAIAFYQLEVAKYLCTSRPVLKSMPDNCNRYPLHYACALPDEPGKQFIKVLLERKPEDLEKKMDKDGAYPAEYLQKRGSSEIQQMLLDARTLDCYGREGPPMGPCPQGTQGIVVIN